MLAAQKLRVCCAVVIPTAAFCECSTAVCEYSCALHFIFLHIILIAQISAYARRKYKLAPLVAAFTRIFALMCGSIRKVVWLKSEMVFQFRYYVDSGAVGACAHAFVCSSNSNVLIRTLINIVRLFFC